MSSSDAIPDDVMVLEANAGDGRNPPDCRLCDEDSDDDRGVDFRLKEDMRPWDWHSDASLKSFEVQIRAANDHCRSSRSPLAFRYQWERRKRKQGRGDWTSTTSLQSECNVCLRRELDTHVGCTENKAIEHVLHSSSYN